MNVYTTTFEIIGEGRKIADAFEAEKQEAKATHWAFVRDVGGQGYRPSTNGGLRSVFFEGELPEGWRSIGTEKGMTEAVPKKTTKVGKALQERVKKIRETPQASALARDLGYSPRFMPTGNGKIYFPTEVRVVFPAERHFLRLPLTEDDGFEADDRLRALPESDFMRALEDHNAEARRLRECAE